MTELERVTGIGGVFFRARDPAVLAAWYAAQLGIQIDPSFGGSSFAWEEPGSTVWAPFAADTDYFGRLDQQSMINYRVRDLDAMLAQLRSSGVAVDDRIEASEFGRFGWASDPEGNRFELWEPPEGQ